MSKDILPKAMGLVTDLMKERAVLHRRARSTDPETSHIAGAKSIQLARDHKKIITDALVLWGPMTTDQIAERTPLLSQQINKRLSDLEDEGKAEPTGKTDLSFSGRPQRVWRAK